jgi:hypothetical protein
MINTDRRAGRHMMAVDDGTGARSWQSKGSRGENPQSLFDNSLQIREICSRVTRNLIARLELRANFLSKSSKAFVVFE